MRTFIRMLPAALAAGSITLLPSVIAGSPAAADEIARMEITPASGKLDTPIDLRLGVTCPKDAPNALVVLTGPGIDPAGENLVDNTEVSSFEVDRTGTTVIPLILPLGQVQQLLPAGTVLDGDYRITMICRQPLDPTSYGEFNAYLAIDAKKGTYRELLDAPVVAAPGPPTMLPQGTEPEPVNADPSAEGSAGPADASQDAGSGAGRGTSDSGATGGASSEAAAPSEDPALTALAAQGENPVAAEPSGSSFPTGYLLVLVGAMLIGGGVTALVRRRAS